MFLTDRDLEDFWDQILSRDPQTIVNAFKPLNKNDRQLVVEHLHRVTSEVGWHSEQRESAHAALKAIEELMIEETRQNLESE